MPSPEVSVIISTYNNTQALRLGMAGWNAQTFKDFEIIIADDGSSAEQVAEINRIIADYPKLIIKHSAIPDEGFQRCKAINHAIRLSEAEYLILTDADIIPRNDFVANHFKMRKPNWFISGGSHIETGEELHTILDEQDVQNNICFKHEFWTKHGRLDKKLKDRLENSPISTTIKNFLTQRRKSFNGSNTSFWKSDFLAVNGFDEDIREYGVEDMDIGLRLSNLGVKSQRYRYSFIALHQTHPKPYKNGVQVKANKRKVRLAHRQGRCVVENGYNPAPPLAPQTLDS